MSIQTQVMQVHGGERAGRYPVAAFCTDQWKTERHQNGVVAYTTHLVEGIRQLGAPVYVVANNVGANLNGDSTFVRAVPSWAEIRGHTFRRGLAGIGRRLAPDYTDGRLLAERLLVVLDRVAREDGVEIFEAEESCGVARMVIPRSPVPVVVRLHGPWFLVGPASGASQDGGFRRRLAREKAALVAAAGISAPSHDVISRTERHYDIDLSRACVIPNPVARVPDALCWTRQSHEPDRLLFVGRFDRGKGADILLAAFARILRERPNASLTLVGRDHGIPDEQGRLVQAEAYITRLLGEHVARRRIERLGVQTPEELRALRRVASCCVVASRYESFSMVTLEAMASGCPIVAPEVGGIPELIRHGRNGLLFSPGDAGGLAEAVLHVLRHPDMAEALGVQARIDASKRHDPAVVARATLEFHRQVLDGRASMRPLLRRRTQA